MNHQWSIASIGIVVAVFACCAEKKPTVVSETPSNKHEHNVAAVTPSAPTRTPLPRNIREDADGNRIKKDGWPIQKIVSKETRRSTETGKTRNGRTVTYRVLSITPENQSVTEAISPEEPNYEWRIRSVDELSGRDGKIFCYQYGATLFGRSGNANSAMATATAYRLCDYDGDGKYEFNGWVYPTITIPDWVK